MVEQILQDVRFAARTFLRDRTFTLAVLFFLTLGIGGTCAFFSVVYGILIDPYNAFRKRLHALVDADQPLAEFDTLQRVLTVNSFSDAQSSATLFTIFASVAMALAGFGVYSVVSFSVAQRDKEIAIRRALGAQSRQVASIILQWLLIVTAAGIALGLLGTLVFGRILAYYEQGWQPSHPMALLAVISLLLIVNVTAILPALWRAVSILPDKVLRAS